LPISFKLPHRVLLWQRKKRDLWTSSTSFYEPAHLFYPRFSFLHRQPFHQPVCRGGSLPALCQGNLSQVGGGASANGKVLLCGQWASGRRTGFALGRECAAIFGELAGPGGGGDAALSCGMELCAQSPVGRSGISSQLPLK